MRASTIAFLIFCAWYYVFQMTPIQHWLGYQPEPRFECGTPSPDQRQINRGYSTDQMKGKVLFEKYCSRCHSMQLDRGYAGLYGISSRIPGGDWIYKWIRDSGQLIKDGDAYARKIYEANGKVKMDPFPELTNKDIDDIMTWIDSY